VLAQAGPGLAARARERIAQGMVKVNGEVARTGQSVGSGDRIELDGRTFVATALTEPSSVLIYNKPEGPGHHARGHRRPPDHLRVPAPPQGRALDRGGPPGHQHHRPAAAHHRRRARACADAPVERDRARSTCAASRRVPDNIVDRLARGVALEDGPAKFEKIERINASGSHSWFQVMLTEGRNREVRRLWESQGYQVSRLKRVRYGEITLPRLLKRGHAVEMEAEEVEKLRRQFGLENAAPVLTLQPVIGQRRSRPVEIRVGKEHAKKSFVNGHVNEEARELRRFDHVREEPRRGRAGPGSAAPRGKPGRRRQGPRRRGNRDDNFGNRIDGPQRRGHGHGDRPFVPRGAKPRGLHDARPQPRNAVRRPGGRQRLRRSGGRAAAGARQAASRPGQPGGIPQLVRARRRRHRFQVAPPRASAIRRSPGSSAGQARTATAGHGDSAYNKPHGNRGPRPGGGTRPWPAGQSRGHPQAAAPAAIAARVRAHRVARGPQGARGPRPGGPRWPAVRRQSPELPQAPGRHAADDWSAQAPEAMPARDGRSTFARSGRPGSPARPARSPPACSSRRGRSAPPAR
jgi:23S rRNA pseudouridine2605 synthase